MRAFFATLFGDLRNCGVVAAVILCETAMVHGGFAAEAAFTVPLATLGGVLWLALPAR